MEGVVRVPSAFSMILTLLPSIIDTQRFVVPRSMPMIFPMILDPAKICSWLLWLFSYLGPIQRFSSLLAGGNHHQCRTQYAIRQGVAFLQDLNNGTGRLFGRHRRDSLMEMRVEFVARSRCNFTHLIALEGAIELTQCGFHTFFPGFGAQLGRA